MEQECPYKAGVICRVPQNCNGVALALPKGCALNKLPREKAAKLPVLSEVQKESVYEQFRELCDNDYTAEEAVRRLAGSFKVPVLVIEQAIIEAR